MTDDLPPQDTREEQQEQRSLTGEIILGVGAFLGPPAAVALDHALSGGDEEPPTQEIELPLGVYVEDD
jgi:hypothetical protein